MTYSLPGCFEGTTHNTNLQTKEMRKALWKCRVHIYIHTLLVMIVITQKDVAKLSWPREIMGAAWSGRGSWKVEALGAGGWLLRHPLGSAASYSGWHLCIHLVASGGIRAVCTRGRWLEEWLGWESIWEQVLDGDQLSDLLSADPLMSSILDPWSWPDFMRIWLCWWK